jgi:hypothetical protein
MPPAKLNIKKIDNITKLIKEAGSVAIRETIYKYLVHTVRTEWK